ncbi:MAG: nitrate/nitrite transporter [Parvibaculaceae bacterium]
MATPGAAVGADASRWIALALICIAVVLSMTTWFSATAITQELQRDLSLSPAVLPWLTNGVQIGFVIGALAASLVSLPDVVRLGRLMAVSAGLAAFANLLLLTEPGPAMLIALRVATGIALAGVYPPALKFVATWFVSGRGLALGAVIGALTLGSSLPHLFRALSANFAWQSVVIAASAATLAGAALFLAAKEGPHAFSQAKFDPRQVGLVLRDRPLLLATIGYLGHMWELYAMWAWLLFYIGVAPILRATGPANLASLVTFAAIAGGALGCLLGGTISDRFGRTATTAGMMIVSGACALAIGFAFEGPAWLFILIILVWGISVIGDSAQFSAAVTELADRRYVGTALSVQLGLGFALTVIVIWLIPIVADALGSWRWSFLILVPGPVIGALAMLRLRTLPDSRKLAGGRR